MFWTFDIPFSSLCVVFMFSFSSKFYSYFCKGCIGIVEKATEMKKAAKTKKQKTKNSPSSVDLNFGESTSNHVQREMQRFDL